MDAQLAALREEDAREEDGSWLVESKYAAHVQGSLQDCFVRCDPHFWQRFGNVLNFGVQDGRLSCNLPPAAGLHSSFAREGHVEAKCDEVRLLFESDIRSVCKNVDKKLVKLHEIDNQQQRAKEREKALKASFRLLILEGKVEKQEIKLETLLLEDTPLLLIRSEKVKENLASTEAEVADVKTQTNALKVRADFSNAEVGKLSDEISAQRKKMATAIQAQPLTTQAEVIEKKLRTEMQSLQHQLEARNLEQLNRIKQLEARKCCWVFPCL
jgi:hypothetical protein